MASRFLLDTNIVSASSSGEASVNQQIARAERIFVSSIVIGELWYGVEKSSRRTQNAARLRAFLRLARILVCDHRTAEVYGKIKLQLEIKGRRIPDNDTWIAAAAIQHDLTLATRDNHFQEVAGLKLAQW